jgi:hypothetical protein
MTDGIDADDCDDDDDDGNCNVVIWVIYYGFKTWSRRLHAWKR